MKSCPHVASVELGGTVSRGMMVVDQRVGTLRVSYFSHTEMGMRDVDKRSKTCVTWVCSENENNLLRLRSNVYFSGGDCQEERDDN